MSEWVLTKKSSPNARLLYVPVSEGPLEKRLSLALNTLTKLEQQVLKRTRYQWANSQVFFYFFAPSSDEKFFELPFWIAREVIGLPNDDPEDFFQIEDLNASEVFTYDLSSIFFENLKFDALFNDEQKLRQKLQKQMTVASTWRVMVVFEPDRPLKVEIQFFPE